MMPILYEAGETAFTDNGIGVLSDAISCTVTEELNGMYELEMQYPPDGVHFSEIALERLIFVKPNTTDRAQPFRIYRVTAGMNGVLQVSAQHISYDLSGVPVTPFEASSAAIAMQKLKSNSAYTHGFSFWTDKTDTGQLTIAHPVSTRAALGSDGESSVLGVYGGELAFDWFIVRLYAQRGADRGVQVRYGKNLIDLEQEKNCAQVYTGILPYAVFDDAVTMLPERVIEGPGEYPVKKILSVDLSSEFEQAPTVAQLRQAGQRYVQNGDIGVPQINLTVQFAQLEQTQEYQNMALLERVGIGDIVSVRFERIGVDAQAKCIATEYDVLLERMTQVALGDSKKTLADTIIGQQGELEKIQSPGFLQAAVEQATELITGNRGGYVVLHSTTGSGTPDELLVMDTPDINTAVNVWRWNKNGLGYSATGYNGPYGTAITADGRIVADFITAGNLNANIITSGAITSANGKFIIDLSNSTIAIENEAGENVLTYSNAGGLMVKGGIFALSGQIGGFTLQNGNLQSNGLTLDVGNKRITFGTVAQIYDIGNTFVVANTNGDISLLPGNGGQVILSGPVAFSEVDVGGYMGEVGWTTIDIGGGATVRVLSQVVG